MQARVKPRPVFALNDLTTSRMKLAAPDSGAPPLQSSLQRVMTKPPFEPRMEAFLFLRSCP